MLATTTSNCPVICAKGVVETSTRSATPLAAALSRVVGTDAGEMSTASASAAPSTHAATARTPTRSRRRARWHLHSALTVGREGTTRWSGGRPARRSVRARFAARSHHPRLRTAPMPGRSPDRSRSTPVRRGCARSRPPLRRLRRAATAMEPRTRPQPPSRCPDRRRPTSTARADRRHHAPRWRRHRATTKHRMPARPRRPPPRRPGRASVDSPQRRAEPLGPRHIRGDASFDLVSSGPALLDRRRCSHGQRP